MTLHIEENINQLDKNRADFQQRIEYLPADDQKLIMDAYSMAEAAHQGKKRDSGEDYFEHLRNVALIYIDECQLKNRDLIIAALLHDSIEESKLFADSKLAYSKWKEISHYNLSSYFNEKVAEMVIFLTRPGVDGVEIKTEEESHQVYIKNLLEGSPDTMILKMCDRLHNLRTQKGTTREKRQRKVLETRTDYLPIFQEALLAYPDAGAYLLEKINKELELLEEMD